MLLNDTQIAHISNFHPYFRETMILSNFYKIHDEKYIFFVVWHNKSESYHMKAAYFGQCSYCPNIDKTIIPKKRN